MARLLALDWDHQQLHVVAATPGSRLHIQHAVTWSDMPLLQPADAEALGAQLRERLDAAGIPLGAVVACLGRDRVILKLVRHPAASPADEPALVRFQAAKELTDAIEDVVIDYTPLDEPAANGERRALALVVRKEVLATYQTLCKAAGLKLVALTPRPFGTLMLWQTLRAKGVGPGANGPNSVEAVVTLAGRWGEFCVVRGNAVLFARSLSPGTALAGEVRRNLAVYAGQWPQYPLAALWIAGDESGTLREQLQGMAAIPVQALDPFAAADKDNVPTTALGGFASAMGLLHAESARQVLPINFVSPKQPRTARDPNQRRIVFYAAAAALLLLALGVFGYGHLALMDRQIEELSDQKVERDKIHTELQPDARRIKALDDWSKTQVSWLDELYDMTERMPDTESVRMADLTATAGDPLSKTAREKSARVTMKAVYRGEGKARDHLMNQLVSENSVRHVSTGGTTRNQTGLDRQRFPNEFTAILHLDSRPPEKYVRQLPPPPTDPDRGRRSRGPGLPDFFAPEGGRP